MEQVRRFILTPAGRTRGSMGFIRGNSNFLIDSRLRGNDRGKELSTAF